MQTIRLHRALTSLLAAALGALAVAACPSDDGRPSTSEPKTDAAGLDGTGESDVGADRHDAAVTSGDETQPGNTGAARDAGADRDARSEVRDASLTDGGTGTGAADAGRAPAGTAMKVDTKIMLLHHSTGFVVWNGGVADKVRAYNGSRGTTYAIDELAYPDGERYPWENYPYDYWHLWVDRGGQAARYANPTLEELTQTYGLIAFKHCFPVSAIEENMGRPDVKSQVKTLENFQAQYLALRERLHGFPNNRFIVWTGAALTSAGSSPEQGARARAFVTWVTKVWDVPGDNIFVWDFFALETEGGNFILDRYAAGVENPHPSNEFGEMVAPLFVKRMTDVLEGRGDTGSLTGK